MRLSGVFLAALLCAVSTAWPRNGGGVSYGAPITDLDISDEPSVWYSTNALFQPLVYADHDRFRFELSAPFFGAERTDPVYPSSSHFLAALSWHHDSGMARVRYRQARRFYSEDGSAPAVNESMRVGRLDIEGYWWGWGAAFWGRSLPTDGGLRDGLMHTDIRLLPYGKLRYSHVRIVTRQSLSQDAGLTNGFDDVREMRTGSLSMSWGGALQTNLAGFYFDTELSLGGGLMLASTERDRAFPEPWRERDPQLGLVVPIVVGFETGYKRGPFRLGLEFRVEPEPAGYDDLSYMLSEGWIAVNLGLTL